MGGKHNQYMHLSFYMLITELIMIKKSIFLIITTILIASCSKSESPEPIIIPKEELSGAKEITSFILTVEDEVHTAIIRNDSIFYKLPSSTDITALKPTITFSDNANLIPASGQATNFTSPVKYTVTAEDRTKKVYVVVLDRYNAGNEITSISFPEVGGYSRTVHSQNPADIDTLAYQFVDPTDIRALKAEIKVSKGASIHPDPDGILDYSAPIKYTITAEDGSVNEVLVLARNRPLQQLSIKGLVYNEFDDAPLGGDITFAVNELSPYLDSIQVQLYSDLESFDLEVKHINTEEKEITVTLPNSYTNNRFNLEVSIAHNNVGRSDGFRLLKGKLNLVEVMDHNSNGSRIPVETILWTGQYLSLSVYLKDDAVDNHEFFLLKEGVYYELKKNGTFYNVPATGVKVEMPEFDASGPHGGTGYKIVIRNAEGEEVFDLKNSAGNDIQVVVAEAPVIDAIEQTTVQKDQTLTVVGSNLFIAPGEGGTNASVIARRSQILLRSANGGQFIYSDTLDANGNLVFDLSEFPFLQSGTYEVQFLSNILVFPQQHTGIMVTLTQPPSEHPTLDVSSAKLYGIDHASAAKQILLTFNGNIDNYEIKQIVVGRRSAVFIENYFYYPTTVLTGALTDEEYNLTWRDRDGYVVVEDNGIPFKIYFVLQMEF